MLLPKDAHPVARLLPAEARRKRVPGATKNMLTIDSDDDSHFADFKKHPLSADASIDAYGSGRIW